MASRRALVVALAGCSGGKRRRRSQPTWRRRSTSSIDGKVQPVMRVRFVDGADEPLRGVRESLAAGPTVETAMGASTALPIERGETVFRASALTRASGRPAKPAYDSQAAPCVALAQGVYTLSHVRAGTDLRGDRQRQALRPEGLRRRDARDPGRVAAARPDRSASPTARDAARRTPSRRRSSTSCSTPSGKVVASTLRDCDVGLRHARHVRRSRCRTRSPAPGSGCSWSTRARRRTGRGSTSSRSRSV